MRSVEREIRGEIMRTDIFVKLLSPSGSEADLNRDLDDAFSCFRDIGRRFSRFRTESELSRLNETTEIKASPEMTTLLGQSLALYRETGGIFDPSILEMLEGEGYVASFGDESFGVPRSEVRSTGNVAFDSLSVDAETGMVRKPKELRIDLGGIAKGFAVDRAVTLLRERGYDDFLLDAGGDIFASGADLERGYGHWVVDIANPTQRESPVALLLLRDVAVATSGTDRRRWTVGDETRHHLIDPRTGKSADTDILSATVIGESVVRAEVFAKTLCVLGRIPAIAFAEERRMAAFLVTEDGETVYTSFMKPYLYDETK
ncbi:MAG: FAD:protein FMN transferase [Candidatus Moraniibacteriota bacterium]